MKLGSRCIISTGVCAVTCNAQIFLFFPHTHSVVSLHEPRRPFNSSGSSQLEPQALLKSRDVPRASPWSNYLAAIGNNSSVVIARLTCVRLSTAAPPSSHAPPATAVDAVQFDIVCRLAPRLCSNMSIVCIGSDSQVKCCRHRHYFI
jgi:hypothetical protein